MGLMERVATLLRANVNDLIDRAEDPEKMLKQLSGHGEPAAPGEDAGGDCDCRSASAGEEKRGT